MNMPNRKILFVSSNFPPILGGSAVVYHEICRHAADQVIALASDCHPDTGERLQGAPEHDASCGYAIHRIRHLRPPSTGKNQGRNGRLRGLLGGDAPVMLQALAAVLRLILRYRAKAVCLGELIYLGWLTFPLRYLFGRTVIIYTHGEEISQDSAGIAAGMRRAYLRHAHHIVAVSLFCKSLIVSKYGIDPAKISVISNGIDTGLFHAGPPRREVFPAEIRSKKIILSVSRLVERKGHDRLIAVMPDILRAVPDAHCLIVGEGPLADKLRRQAEDIGVSAAVTFMGKVSSDTLADLYRSTDVFVLPCRTLPDGDTEGYGLVFLEAGACGAPVVAGAAGGTVEAVIDGETGLLVDANSESNLADTVIRILSQPDVASALAEQAQRRAAGKGWSKAAAAFKEVCARNGARTLAATFEADSLIPALRTSRPPRLLMSVDVEEQFLWSEFSRSEHSVGGLAELKILHETARELGIAPVYLVTQAILDDDAFCEFLRTVHDKGEGEIGLHLHSWITEPFWDEPNVFNSYQCNLPPHVQRRKLETMWRSCEGRLGLRPRIHRAGRWGGDAQTTALLAEMGFEVDLSPSTGYNDPPHGGPNFMNLDGRPFWLDGGSMLTVPASSVNYLRGPNFFSWVFFDRGFAARAAKAPTIFAGKPVRFSSEGQPLPRLKAIARQFVRIGLPVAVTTIHSTSLYNSGNPYATNDEQARDVMNNTKELLRYCVETLHMQPTTCAELFAAANAER